MTDKDGIDIAEATARVGAEVDRALRTAAPGLRDLTAHLTNTRGKGARTALLMNCAADDLGNVEEPAIKAAAAIELLHMATLAHDDVIDKAQTRRGEPSLNAKFGDRSAVICGDYLLCLSLSKLAEAAEDSATEQTDRARLVAGRLIAALTLICKGEYLQSLSNGDVDMDLFSYLRIINGKTASLFFVAAYAGALFGREDDKNAVALGNFGRVLGLIFQILDDCKDYALTEEQASKPTAKDASSGVITLPLILATAREPRLKALAREVAMLGVAPEELIVGVKKANGVGDSLTLATRLKRKAERTIAGVSMIKRERLIGLLDKLILSAKKDMAQ